MNPLSHLTPSQIEAIYRRYLEGEKTSALISEYKIRTDLPSLLEFLPYTVRDDLVCPHCTAPAMQRRAARNGLAPPPTCNACDHVFVVNGDLCSCRKCSYAYICNLNGGVILHGVPENLLTAREKILLLATLSLAREWETTCLSIRHKERGDHKLAPTAVFHDRCVAELRKRRILIVSHDTLPQHLLIHRNHLSLDPLIWIPNVTWDTEIPPTDIVELRELLRSSILDCRHDIVPTITGLLSELAVEELIQYLIDQISKTRITLEGLEAFRPTLHTLLKTASVSEIFGFIRLAVKQTEKTLHDRLDESENAADSISSSITRAAVSQTSRLSSSKRVFRPRLKRLGICHLSKVLYDLILDDPDGAFKTPLPRYIERVVLPALEEPTGA